MVNLGTLADTSTQREFTRSSEALDVREDWGVVGRSQNFNGVWRAFAVGINSMINSGAAMPGLIAGTGGAWTSAAYGVNRLWLKVGTAQTNAAGGTFVSRAVQWDAANGITDLNTVLPANSGWVVTSAIGINDNGFIIGWGTHNGNIRPYLLSPNRN